MKKIVYYFGILFVLVVILVNLLFTARLDTSEHVEINFNEFFYIVGAIILSIALLCITYIFNKYLTGEDEKIKKKRKIIFIISITLYIVANITWVIFIRPAIVGDQIHACNMAQTFYRNNLEEFLPNLTYAGIPLSEYMQAYHQQISLAFVFSLFFRIIHFDGIGVLRVLNVIGNIAVVFALYKITVQISKKYKTNKVRMFSMILTFFSLIMAATFIYGDIPGLALCLWATYFMMKYSETKKINYPIIASIFTMIAYMMRMNNLIFIIATVIYLFLNLFNEIKSKSVKEKLINAGVIAMYIIVSIIPAGIVKNYYLDKYNMDKTKEYPNISYFYMAMEESWRGNGWYNEDIGEPALRNPEEKKVEYKEKIKERLQYFGNHPGYTIDFYTKKIASMWAETTYSQIRNNMVGEDFWLEKMTEPLEFYQKALVLLMFGCTLVVLIQNRKNLSIDVIFLLTIFAGGFAFHILWEAKSRYIMPYLISLIPIASIEIEKIKICRIKGEKINEFK